MSLFDFQTYKIYTGIKNDAESRDKLGNLIVSLYYYGAVNISLENFNFAVTSDVGLCLNFTSIPSCMERFLKDFPEYILDPVYERLKKMYG